MHRFQATLVALALFVAVGATPALAARTIPQLVGASPTLGFGPPTCQLGIETCTYVYSNQGTARGERPVTWRYDEQGTVFADFRQEIASATYTIKVLDGKSGKPAETIVLHVIPESYQVIYDTPDSVCSGSFSQRTVEGATIRGTFGCPGGVPSGSMEFAVQLGG